MLHYAVPAFCIFKMFITNYLFIDVLNFCLRHFLGWWIFNKISLKMNFNLQVKWYSLLVIWTNYERIVSKSTKYFSFCLFDTFRTSTHSCDISYLKDFWRKGQIFYLLRNEYSIPVWKVCDNFEVFVLKALISFTQYRLTCRWYSCLYQFIMTYRNATKLLLPISCVKIMQKLSF